MMTALMTQSDAMESFDAMLVYADMLDETGNPQHCAVRAAAWHYRQVCELLPSVELLPTGSRFYGSYARIDSDWDWFGFVGDELPDAAALLGFANEFREGGSASDADSLSAYVGTVNVILFRDMERYRKFSMATDECRQVNPPTREAVMAIFEKHGAKKR